MKQLARTTAVMFCLVALFIAILPAKNRKADKLLKEGGAAEVRKDYEKALQLYEDAESIDPGDAAYQLAARRVRFQAGTARVDQGMKLRAAGKLEEALASFLKAFAIDPSSSIAVQEIKRTQEMLAREKNGGKAAAPEERGMTPVERAEKETDEKSAAILAPPELKPMSSQVLVLRINNQPPKVLFETLGKTAGINVIFDPEYAPMAGGTNGGRFTVDLSNTTVEEALDYLAVQTKSFWKPISANAIFVTNENVGKRRDYEDYVVKVFYIKNAVTVQDLTEISTTVRSITEIRRAYTYNAQNAILMRGTVDQMALAEKLIADLDKPKAEVVVDVIIMEADKQKIRDLAAAVTTAAGAPGINIPIAYGPATTSTTSNGNKNSSGTANPTATPTTTNTTTTTTTSLALDQLKNIGIKNFSLNIPGALLQATISDSTSRVLQQPQLRAVDGNKSTLKIGEKIPYATGSFGSGIGSVGNGASPLVSTQFNFFEVGINIDITPKIHGRDEVSMLIDLELSGSNTRVDIGGISQPVINQKHIVHNIRLKEGEVSLLGGLINMQDSRTVAGIPGLSNIPVLGRLFGSEHTDHTRGDLVIALVPHIIRAPEYNDSNLRTVAAGSDAVLKLSYGRRGVAPAAAAPPAATTPAPAPTVPAAPTPAAPPSATPASANSGSARLAFDPGTVQANLASPITVVLKAENVTDLFSLPLTLRWDPKILRLAKSVKGDFLTSDGQQANFSENTLNDAGEATIVLSRFPNTPGVNGSGTLVTFTFQAIASGSTNIRVDDLHVQNSKFEQIAVPAPSVPVTVQ